MIKYKILTMTNFSQYIPKVIKLFQLCFTAPISDRVLRWRYMENPFGDLNAVIAVDDERVVGFIGTMPTMVCCQSQRIKSAMFTNMMTHPDYSGNGIFTNMVRNLEAHLAAKGYMFIYSFPNSLSNHILIDRLQWKDIYEIPTMELRLHDISAEKYSSEIHPEIENWIDVGLDDIESEGVAIFKESKYLTWRYKNHPTNEYFLSIFEERCWAIHHVYGTEMNITELHYGGNVQMLKKMADYYISLAVEQGCEKLTTWAGINTIFHLVLERKGFINRAPIRYFGGKILAYRGDRDLLDYGNWTVYMGDDNVY